MTIPAAFHGLLDSVEREGERRLVPRTSRPSTIPCPSTGRALVVATIDAQAEAICPRCFKTGRGAFVSFVSDLRMAYACPACQDLIWVAAV